MADLATVTVCFDTTTLCSAIRKPDGLAMKLLDAAWIGLVTPIITEEVIAEWVRHCRQGISGVVYPDPVIRAFCALLEPLLAPEAIEAVDISRAMSPLHPISVAAGVSVIQSPQGQARHSTFAVDESTLALKDLGDLHVLRAALLHGCDYLCTANTRDFPDGQKIGSLEFIHPKRLHPLIMALDN